MTSLGAAATVDALRQRLRAAGVRGVPRGPRATTAANLAGLTKREMDVLRYMPTVLTAAEIAVNLSISVNTVKAHMRSIYRKLDAARRREAVVSARQRGLL